MSLETAVPEYSSPIRKLVRFFDKSRKQWKQKCQDVKRDRKLLKNQVRAVERSRDHWKQLAHERQQRIAQLEAELQKLDDTI